MTVYVDMYFIVNFLFDLLVLFICMRILGYRFRMKRLLLACTLGSTYALLALSFTSPYAVLLHLLFGVLILLVACGFGSVRRFLRLSLLFFGVCFLMGGAVMALGRGIALFRATQSSGYLVLLTILICGAAGAFLCLFWGKTALIRPGRHSAAVQVSNGNQSLSFQGYADTGNMLRDPLENTPVILANAALSRKIYALYSSSPPPCGKTIDPFAFQDMPFRLIPCTYVGVKTVLPAIKFANARIDGEPYCICVALDFNRTSEFCGFEALLPAAIL